MFEGVYTAMITPFNTDGSVDYGRFSALIDLQAEAGIDGVVPVGTTGESPTVTYDENIKVVAAAVEASRGRLRVVAGTGANSTAEAMELTQRAKDAGADGTLQVTPYYNRPSQTGLIRHFTAVADLGLPVMLYNVPGRTGCAIDVPTVIALAEHPGIVAIKEAAGTVSRITPIRAACNITVVSGDDALTLPMLALGAAGVVSVASNIVPHEVVALVRHAAADNWSAARQAHYDLHDLFTALFLDTNPVPVKAAMAMLGLINEVYRLPLCAANDPVKAQLRATLHARGLL
jgi:4-hydroxy-tetrahydrodipicolinate synthase